MNHLFNELAKSLAQSVSRGAALKKFGAGLAGLALVCFGLASAVEAQTSVTCDPAGDAIFGNGNGGPAVPAWLDIVTGTVTDAGDSILFTMRVNAPIPLIPSWSLEDDFGQFWWSWRND